MEDFLELFRYDRIDRALRQAFHSGKMIYVT